MKTITLYHVNASFPKLHKGWADAPSAYNYTVIKTSLLAAYREIQLYARDDEATLIYQGRHIPKQVLKNLNVKGCFGNFPIATWVGENISKFHAETIGATKRYYSITAYKIKIK